MGFIVADGDKNLVLYMYQPESRESFGGIIVVSCNILFHNFCTLIFIMRSIKYFKYFVYKYFFLSCKRYKL